MSKLVTISPSEAADRLAIRELVEAYAHCADRRDATRQIALFTADAHFVVYMGFPPNAEATGDIDSMDLLAGQSVGLIHEVKPAGQIVGELVAEARQIISQRLAGLIATKANAATER